VKYVTISGETPEKPMSDSENQSMTRCTRRIFNQYLPLGLVLILTACTPDRAERVPQLAADGLEQQADVLQTYQRMAKADILVLGEIHDNPDHHRLQAKVLTEMLRRGRRPAIVWEMIPRGMQALLDSYVGDADSFGSFMAWNERGWPDWQIYQPIAEVALAAKLPMRGGDLDPATIRLVSSKGFDTAFGMDRARRLGLNRSPSLDIQASMLQEQADAHCGLMPAASLAPMVDVQRARDAALAEAALFALTAPGVDSVIVITGAIHARKDRGVPAVLAHIAPSVDVFALGLREGEGAAGTKGDLPANLFDAVWSSPPGPQIDHCAELRKRLDAKSR